MPQKNYYKILQLDPSADPEVIAAAYRKLANKYHPDKNSSADAKSQMQAINEAHDVLKDPALRAEYDAEIAGDEANVSSEPPRFEPVLREISVDGVDPRHPSVAFTLDLRQVGGPKFIPGLHQIYIDPKPPWDWAKFAMGDPTYVTNDLVRVDVSVDLSDLGLQHDTTYSGDIEFSIEVHA